MIWDDDKNERRNLRRMGISCPATITVLSDGREEQGNVLDLSGSGMSLQSGSSFVVGASLRVRLVPDKPIFMPLVADVEVVRVEPATEGMTLYGLQINQLLS